MRTSIDILNYFRRSKQRKEIAKLKRELKKAQKGNTYFEMKYIILKRKLEAQKPYKEMYNDLVGVLDNISEYCVLRPTTKVRAPHPLQRIAISNYNLNNMDRMFQYHYTNLDTAEILIRDYMVEECIHFELDTGDGQYRYQYSKKSLALQPIKRILKEVTQMMASAWYNKIHN